MPTSAGGPLSGLSINNTAACSLKTSNLKYHLMRDLLQKKSLEDIILLKQKLKQNTLQRGESSRPGSVTKKRKNEDIKFPGPKFTGTNISTSQQPHQVGT